MLARAATLVLGIWVFASGLYSHELLHQPLPQYAVGLGLIVVTLIALAADRVRWLGFVGGVWLLAAPFVFAYHSSLNAFNSYSIGILVMLASAYSDRPNTYMLPTTYTQELYATQGGGKAIR